ncbi:hypothetical protein M3Y95_00563400 [Aphelenchoides besseyi]|nr:hypothetical protein M3Y95_00563400 [Aphelenchoides besseyi]
MTDALHLLNVLQLLSSFFVVLFFGCGKKKASKPTVNAAPNTAASTANIPATKPNVVVNTACAKDKSTEEVKNEKKDADKKLEPVKKSKVVPKPVKKEPFAPAKENIKTMEYQKTIEANEENKKGALISNPIVTNVTEPFPTVSKQLSKKEANMEKTQESIAFENTQKDT